jgi:hypothetical protein
MRINQMNTIACAEEVTRDIRHSLRLLRTNPGFSAAALLSLALGIGANTAIFSVVNGIIIRPLPYPEPEALAGVFNLGVFHGETFSDMAISPGMYKAYEENSQTFQAFGVWTAGSATLSGAGDPEQVATVTITQGLLPALGVPPHLGRWFSKEDDTPGTQETAILSYGYWQRKFGGDPAVLGRTILVDFLPR